MAYEKNDLSVVRYRRASQPLPTDGTMTSKVGPEFKKLQTYLDSEFKRVEDSLNTLSDAAPQVAFKEPDVKKLGMIRYAKSPWDPLGTGNAWVWWDGSAWTAL